LSKRCFCSRLAYAVYPRTSGRSEDAVKNAKIAAMLKLQKLANLMTSKKNFNKKNAKCSNDAAIITIIAASFEHFAFLY